MLPVCVPASGTQTFQPGDLVEWNGYKGSVAKNLDGGKVRVSFGHGRTREIPQESLTVFVPWWSDKD